MLPQAVSDHYRAQRRLILATLNLTASTWRRMNLDDLDGSWERVGPALATIMSSAQEGAARNGLFMVPRTLDELGQSVDPDALVQPKTFAGWSSDGRSLDGLLVGAKIHAKQSQSLDSAGQWLGMVAHTLVSDASRQAAGVATFVRPRVGYVRAVNPPCCQRCAVLAGKFSRSDVAFPRHPRCDCTNVPTAESATHPGVTIGPDDVKDLTRAQRQAIADGGDMNQVINSHRANTRGRNGLTTTEGSTKRGGRQRLTPEGIYKIASDRPEALRLLRAHGYIL